MPALHIAVAVSGGADSMACALLAKDYCDARKIRLTALTVDHGLRPESATEARQVQVWMTAQHIAHITLTPAPNAHIANLQTRARTMRYDALTAWCLVHEAPLLLVAHHADDQAETIALQQHRGDSPPSRSGMALVTARDGIHLVRPLLGTRKTMLMNELRARNQPWIDDPSNRSDRFARNRLRRTLDDATTIALWHEAQRAGQQRHTDDVARTAWLHTHAQEAGTTITLPLPAWRALPDAQRTDLLSRVIQTVGGKPFRPRHHETQRLDAQLCRDDHGHATLGHCKLGWRIATGLRIAPEHSLEMAANLPHIHGSSPLKVLGNKPFWWFNYPLL